MIFGLFTFVWLMAGCCLWWFFACFVLVGVAGFCCLRCLLLVVIFTFDLSFGWLTLFDLCCCFLDLACFCFWVLLGCFVFFCGLVVVIWLLLGLWVFWGVS